jgi:PAS domain S-box-containing protein
MKISPLPRDQNAERLTGDRRFELLVEAVKDYAIYLLDVNGHVNSWNSGAQNVKGYTAAEIIGQHFSVFYTDADRASGLPQAALRTAIDEGKFESEGWRVRKDGTQFWTSVVIDPIFDENQKLIGFAKITRDITERKRAQEEIERGRDALHHSQKMEAIGRLTGGVAHDFNNLLTVIRSSADLLRRPGLPEERRVRYVDAIAQSAERAATLTRQLLAFARQQPLQPQRFKISERIERLRQILESTVGAAVKTDVHFNDQLAIVEADPTQFETAIINIAVNARDAMPQGGSLTITTRNVAGVPAIRGHAPGMGNFVVIRIQDTGTGIAPGTLARIFEPFFTTKPVDQGTGLGLSQVYGFAKQSGGEIEVLSQYGQGTTFNLYLPHAKASCDEPEITETTPNESMPTVAKHILLVEDNAMVGQFALDVLTDLGQKVVWATSGAAALEILTDRHAEFDLVFSDVVMPGMNGIELGRQIRRLWPRLRVVLTSGYSQVLADEGRHGFELIHKPYSVDDLTNLTSTPTRSD